MVDIIKPDIARDLRIILIIEIMVIFGDLMIFRKKRLGV